MRAPRTIRLRLSERNSARGDVVLFCLAFALLRIVAVVGRPPARFPDSASYMDIDFLGRATRLWTVPLLYNAFPNDNARVLAQVVLGIACWSALALSVSSSIKNQITARAGAVLVLLLGLCAQVTVWDRAILSESAALSLTALLVATLLWLDRQRSKRALVATFAVLVLWVFTRQLQAAVYVLVSILAIAWILLRARRHAPIALALAVLAVWSGYAVTQSKTVIHCTAYNIITIRIQKTSEGAKFLSEHGMPGLPAKEAEYGCSDLAHADPEFLTWIDDHWPSTYAAWLLRHPIGDIRLPLADAPRLLTGFPSGYGAPRSVLPSTLQDTLWERSSGDLPLWLALVGVAWLASLRAARRSRLDVYGFAAVGIAALLYFLAWHLAATELPRLTIEAAALLRIGLILLLLASLDRLALRRLDASRS